MRVMRSIFLSYLYLEFPWFWLVLDTLRKRPLSVRALFMWKKRSHRFFLPILVDRR